MRCPLCGYEFEATAMLCHTSCVLNESCRIICCPNCGYQTPDEQQSRLANVIRRLLARKSGEEQPAGIHPLSGVMPGQTAKIIAIHSKNHTRIERLNVMGLIVSAQVEVKQQYPVCVLQAGFTELAVEPDIADEILVEVVQD